LKALLKSLGITTTAGCSCNSKAAQMDAWGVAGCREHRAEIIGWIRDGQTQWGLSSLVIGAVKALTTGLALSLNPLDPIPGLVDEAIRRAENLIDSVSNESLTPDPTGHT